MFPLIVLIERAGIEFYEYNASFNKRPPDHVLDLEICVGDVKMVAKDPVNHLSQIWSPIVPEKSKLLVKESVDASVLKPGLIHMGVGHDKLVEDFLTGEMSNIVL